MSFGRCTISSGNLNVRSTASTSGSILFTIKKNEVATILSSSGNWYRINHPSGTGYVSKDYFTLVNAPTTTITVATASSSGKLNIRSGPDTSYPVVFQAANGTSLSMHEEGDSWTLVSHGDQIGWGSNQYLQYQGGSTPGGDSGHRNADYSAADIANGTAVWYNDGSTEQSDDIYELQLNLMSLGYRKNNAGRADGRGVFGPCTEEDVFDFQSRVYGITSVDGKVGRKTYEYIQKAITNIHYFSVGRPLTTAQWGQDVIAAGTLSARDVLARIIYAEDKVEGSQRLIAKVIKERTTVDSEKTTGVSDKWLAVISRVYSGGSVGFTTANPSNEDARTPYRAHTKENGLHDRWKNAVDIADILIAEEPLVLPTVYTINGSNYTGAVTSYSGQRNFKNYPSYLKDANQGEASTAICIYASRSAAINANDADHTVAYNKIN